MRLIDADALISDTIKTYCADCDRRKGMKRGKMALIYEIGDVPCRACGTGDMIETLEDAPTVDAVEVVRCKDCDFYMEAPWGGDMMCYNGLAEGFEFTAPDDYCSRQPQGRRREG